MYKTPFGKSGHICTYVRMYVCMYVYACMHVRVCMYAYMYVCMHASPCMHVHMIYIVCARVRVCVCACDWMYMSAQPTKYTNTHSAKKLDYVVEKEDAWLGISGG